MNLTDLKSIVLWKAYNKGPMARTLARLLDKGEFRLLKNYREEKALSGKPALNKLVERRSTALEKSPLLRRMTVHRIAKAEGR